MSSRSWPRVSSVDGLDVDEIEVRASVTVPLPHRLTVLAGGGLLLVALCLRTSCNESATTRPHCLRIPSPSSIGPLWTTTALGLVWATVPMPDALFIWLSNATTAARHPPPARLALGSGVALISVGVSVAAGL